MYEISAYKLLNFKATNGSTPTYKLFLFIKENFINSPNRFENGTVNFHAILAIRHGIRNLKTHVTSMKNVSLHTSILAQMLYLLMSDLKYSNGQSVVEIYSHTKFRDPCSQGAIIAFNLLTEKGDYIGYAHVKFCCIF